LVPTTVVWTVPPSVAPTFATSAMAVVKFSLAGSISDFDAVAVARIASDIAAMLGLGAAVVKVSVAAGSVTVTVSLPEAAAADLSGLIASGTLRSVGGFQVVSPTATSVSVLPPSEAVMAQEELAASAAPSAMPTATPTLIFADLVDPSLAEVLIVVLIVLGALALLTGARASHALARALGGAAVSEGGTVRALCGAAIACCIRILAKNQALPRAACLLAL
jgi:hypothetical protein